MNEYNKSAFIVTAIYATHRENIQLIQIDVWVKPSTHYTQCILVLARLDTKVQKGFALLPTEMFIGVFKSVSKVNNVKILSLCISNSKNTLKNSYKFK